MGLVIYYRIDPKGQKKKGLSLETQKLYIESFFKKRNFVAEFVEIANNQYMNFSSRPKLYEAVELCQNNPYRLVVATIGSLSQNRQDVFSIFDLLEGRLFSCDIPKLDEHSLRQFLAIDNRKRKLISIRTKYSLSQKKAKGFVIGNASNFTDEGRKKGRKANQKKARTDLEKIKLKALCIRYQKDNLTLREIAHKLTDSGFRTSRNKEFKPNTIKRLLEWEYIPDVSPE